MAELGVPASPILAREDRAPIWPTGVVGSISHCRAYCCAVVGLADAWVAVGLDAELLQPLEPDLEQQILVEDERRGLEHLRDGIPWACVVFSIKEAIYKAWHPLMQRWLGFHDAFVRVDPPTSRFEADLSGAGIPASFKRVEGRFVTDGPLVISALALPR
jgi:4'-phosphopantetheinyl transferase EntD